MKHRINLTLITCLFISILIGNQMNGQECGAQLLDEQLQYMEDTEIERADIDISQLVYQEGQVNFQIAAHIIRDSNGENGLSLEDLQVGIEDLNSTYEQVNFSFQICNINYIDNQTYFNRIDFPSDNEVIMATDNAISNVINIFFVPKIYYRQNDACGWAYYPSSSRDWIVMKSSCTTNGSTLAHEMGHYFNLYHTHETYQGIELVNRTTGCGPGIGDDLCDTPADPTAIQEISYYNHYCTEYLTCKPLLSNTELCAVTDSLGDVFKPDLTNVMGYNFTHCRTFFSPQQIERMHISYMFDRAYLNNYCEITCDSMQTKYEWLEGVTCQSDSTAEVNIYYFDEVSNYLAIQTGNERNLYLSTGELVCSGLAVDSCIINLELTEILLTCNLDCPNVYGCTDMSACNYNADASLDDGSCDYGNAACVEPCNENSCIEGCTDSNACNFNPIATVEDNSCLYNISCLDLVVCPNLQSTNICAPVSAPPALTLADFLAINEANVSNWFTFQVETQTEWHDNYTSTTYTYFFTDRLNNQKTCTQSYYMINQFLQTPELVNPPIVCQDDLWSYLKLGSKEYKIYADSLGTKAEELTTCNTPGLHCSTSALDVNTANPGIYPFWLTQFFTFPDGTICESPATPFFVEIYPKPIADLSTESLTLSIGQGLVLTDLVNDTTSGYWTGENIIHIIAADGENIPYFNSNMAGIYKLYYTVKNEHCEQSYLVIVEVSNQAGKRVGETPTSYLFEDNQAWQIYPNPTNGQVNIELMSSQSEINVLQLLDLSGQVLQTTKFTGNQFTFEVGNFSKGLYILELQNAQEKSIQKLIIE